MIGIIDFGIGNLGSVRRAVARLGAEPLIVTSPQMLFRVDHMILPGVGGFADGMALLQSGGWVEPIRNRVQRDKKPLLGICLGMQLLASRGSEGGYFEGLNFISGDVVHLDSIGCRERIPHVGWNEIRYTGVGDILFAGIPSGTDFYFVHSYAFSSRCQSNVIAEVDYGVSVAAAVREGNVWGTQFHPEKSSKFGFRLLKNFLEASSC